MSDAEHEVIKTEATALVNAFNVLGVQLFLMMTQPIGSKAFKYQGAQASHLLNDVVAHMNELGQLLGFEIKPADASER